MTIGLFVCDHVKKEQQDAFGDYPDMFAVLFPEFSFKQYDVCNNIFPEDLDECDIYMATGSKHSVYDDIDWIHQLKEVIRNIYDQEKYFIGFCFGHQLMGEALGGKVAKSPNGWCVGVHTFDIQKKESWMQPEQKSINLLMMCQDQVLQLPPNATLIAGNKQCPVGIMRIGNKMLGVQAHPEFTSTYDRFLMESRVDRMGESIVNNGIKSLENTVHRGLIHNWILQFLNH